MDQGPQFFRHERDAKHLLGGFRQLVGLVNDEPAVFREDGPLPRAAVNGICQKQVVVADLKLIPSGITHVHKAEIPAVTPATVAYLGDTYALPVITTEMDRQIQVQMIPQRQQGIPRLGVFPLQVDNLQPLSQALIAHIVGLALAYDGAQWSPQDAVYQQEFGEKRQVTVHHRVLEGDAGGGNQNWKRCQALRGPETVECRPGHQTGIGLADSSSSVTKGDAAVQHSVQHLVAQHDLCRTLRHPLGREQASENMVDFVMDILPVILGIHP